ncbi:MAG: DUF5677 domain-containing protein [Coriobacteriia bacterium]|nr:DUF5677 domain-containing protein [Coriobacteriia bacterium]
MQHEESVVGNLSERLLVELGCSLDRLEQWLTVAKFGHPLVAVVPDPTFDNWDPAFVPLITRHFVNRSCRLGRCIQLLTEQNLSIEAQPVLRTAVEAAIDLRYISTNPVTLVTKWMLFEDVVRLKGLRDDLPSDRPRDFKQVEAEVTDRLSRLDATAPHRNGKPWKVTEIARDWDQSSVERRYHLAESRLGESGQAWYDLYRLLCAHVHGGTETFREFVRPNQDGKYVYSNVPPRTKSVFVLSLALLVLMEQVISAHRCGAHVDPVVIGPRFHELGATRDDIVEAASRDFDVNLHG